MARNLTVLDQQLRELSLGYPLSISDDYDWIIASRFRLPPGFNLQHTTVLLEIPSDYPLSPPGIGSRVYLPPSLRFGDKKLKDLHEGTTPGWGSWAWFCYEWIRWDPHRDDLVKFLEMIRADLTNPPTRK